jgi:hypothetical protein
MTPTPWRTLSATLLLGLACNTNFEKQSQIERVRVLGVRSEPAELVVPTTAGPLLPLQLEALAVAPEGRPVAVRFALCRLFANVYAADFQCPGKDGVEFIDGGLSLADPRVQALFLGPGGGGGQDPFANPLLAAQLDTGLSLQVGYEATDGTDGGSGIERGFAIVRVRRTDAPNHNPDLADVTVDGGSLQGASLPRATTVVLSPVMAEGALETYAVDGGQAQESISLSWYASGDAEVGSLRSVISASDAGVSTTTLTTPDGGGATSVWVVARDGRGGTSWLRRELSSP